MLFTNHFMRWCAAHPGSIYPAKHYVKTILDNNPELKDAIVTCIRIENRDEDVELNYGAREPHEFEWELADRLWNACGKMDIIEPTKDDPDDYAIFTVPLNFTGIYDIFSTLFRDNLVITKDDNTAVYKFPFCGMHMYQLNPETCIVQWFVTMYKVLLWSN